MDVGAAGASNQRILKTAKDVELLGEANPKYTATPAVPWKLALQPEPGVTCKGQVRFEATKCHGQLPDRDFRKMDMEAAQSTQNLEQAFERAHHVVCDHWVISEVFIRQGRTSEQILCWGGRTRTFSLQNGWYFEEKDVQVQFLVLQEQKQLDKVILAPQALSTIQLLSGRTSMGWDFLARVREWHLDSYLLFVTEVSERQRRSGRHAMLMSSTQPILQVGPSVPSR